MWMNGQRGRLQMPANFNVQTAHYWPKIRSLKQVRKFKRLPIAKSKQRTTGGKYDPWNKSEKCSFSTFWFVKVINIKIPNIKIWKMCFLFQIILESVIGKRWIFTKSMKYQFFHSYFWNICDGKIFSIIFPITDISKSVSGKIETSYFL